MIQKKLILILAIFLCLHTHAQFTNGNLVVYRIGDGAAPIRTDGTANPAFLDEYTPSGTLVQSIALPASASGGNYASVARSSLPEGMISRSVDGRYIMFTGYNTSVGLSASAADKVVGRIDFSEGINITTIVTSTNLIASVASTDGEDIWSVAENSYVFYNSLGSSAGTGITNSYGTGVRDIQIYDGQLYVSTSNSIAAVGNGLPEAGIQTFNNLPGSITGNFYQFVMFDLDATVPGNDVLYAADQGGAIDKYSLVGGNWVANGSIAAGLYPIGLTGVANGSSVTLYATTNNSFNSTGGGAIQTLTDAAGYNAAITASLTTIATASSNTTFRGIAFTPSQFILPVKFKSFSAVQVEKKFKLTWETEGMDAEVEFVIERSVNGIQFSEIGRLRSDASSHSFIDLQPLARAAYYRIMAKEISGNVYYSSVIRTGKYDHSLFRIYPSPINNSSFTMVIDHPLPGKYDLDIVNMNGQVVYRSLLIHTGHRSSHNIQLKKLIPGAYLINCNGQSMQVIVK